MSDESNTDVYYVQRTGDDWLVKIGSEFIERYSEKEKAVETALLTAANSSERGRPASVLVESADGTFVTERNFTPPLDG